jgi:hypothetical protein
MGKTYQSGFAETTTDYVVPRVSDFIQAERDRLRAGTLDATPIADQSDPRLEAALLLMAPSIDRVDAHDLMKFGEVWRTRHQGKLRETKIGTSVVVDFASGLYVCGSSSLGTSDQFHALFGTNRSAWSFEHGVPITLGGGLWALRSEV